MKNPAKTETKKILLSFIQDLVYFLVVTSICLAIPVVVAILFAVAGASGIPWYVTAVSILLVGRFIFGLLEH